MTILTFTRETGAVRVTHSAEKHAEMIRQGRPSWSGGVRTGIPSFRCIPIVRAFSDDILNECPIGVRFMSYHTEIGSYQFTGVFTGRGEFSDYGGHYSVTTSRHQNLMRGIVDRLVREH